MRKLTDGSASAEPVLIDILPAVEALPGLSATTILTSGPPMAWECYEGGQRNAIIGGALFEGLAATAQEAQDKLAWWRNSDRAL